MPAALNGLRRDPHRSGIFLDFDGTLSDIAARPELARPHPDAPSVLAGLVRSFAVLAVVSGRPSGQIRELLPVPGLRVLGLYGLENDVDVRGVRDAVAAVAELVGNEEGAWVEDKGASLAVHFRASPDPGEAAIRLGGSLTTIAVRLGLQLLPGKMVLELAPAGMPGKGAAIAREVRDRALAACLYAGDDQADLDAFAALDELRSGGIDATKVAVRSRETPADLIGAADVEVRGSAGLLDLLRSLL